MDRQETPAAALLSRHSANPILTPRRWPYPCNAVFNAGAARLADGATLLLCRVEDHRGQSHLCAARSAGGLDDWQIDAAPTLLPEPRQFPAEAWGIEDPRITHLAELDQFAVIYASYSQVGPCVSLALTEDFRRFERKGTLLPVDNKDAALFPRRVDGQWLLLHRPVSAHMGSGHLWLARSPDLLHWGRHEPVLLSRPLGWWDSAKIGLATPPIETERGWLILYHGVRATAAGSIYRVGAALLDLENPARCLARGHGWLLSPEADYERSGDVPNVVFPCGHVLAGDGDTLRVYYGAADSVLALATGSVRAILASI